MLQTMLQKIEQTPYKNVYWFSRYLLNTDQYGAIGKQKEKRLLDLIALLEAFLAQDDLSEEEKIALCKNTFLREIDGFSKKNSKSAGLYHNFAEAITDEFHSTADVIVFCFSVKYVLVPMNHALASVPSDDKAFSETAASYILDTFGEEKVGTVIAAWDNLGVRGCLNAERAAVMEAFEKLLYDLSAFDRMEHTDFDNNLILTAYVQEFERRLGQKRKSRGGGSLEAVVSFLFHYYGFASAEAPSHFDQDLEIDKWFECKDGWSIGISCKRTLRERWKQVSQADRGTLSHFKIRELWHIITYDKDLTDDKIVRLGEQGQIFYLMDDGAVYQRCAAHPGMKDYVRPLSELIGDIRTRIKKTKKSKS